jgi:DNA invertase Pin-like site-specific DNA recombinase
MLNLLWPCVFRSDSGLQDLCEGGLKTTTSTPAGEAAAGMMSVLSPLERRLISPRTREALAVQRPQGVRGRQDLSNCGLETTRPKENFGLPEQAKCVKTQENSPAIIYLS